MRREEKRNFITTSTEVNRIESIDSLRAFALLGILVVHSISFFGLYDNIIVEDYDKVIRGFVNCFLATKCNTIFNILFGLSFYFIMRKGSYSVNKFIFRSLLLIGFGFINKIFYSYDILMLYGVCAIILTLFYKLSQKKILIAGVIFLFLSALMSYVKLGDYLLNMFSSGNTIQRYTTTSTVCSIVCSTLPSVKEYMFYTLNWEVYKVLGGFMLGYYAGLSGLTNKIHLVNIQHMWKCVLYVIVVFPIYYFLIPEFTKPPFNILFNFSMAVIYIMSFMFLFYNTKMQIFFQKFIPYGKLGLTNYSIQSIIGVLVVLVFKFTNILAFLLVMLGVYILQLIFSTYWLKRYQYGPLEYLWRSLVNCKFSGNKI